jgi:hypothetical protein
MEVEHFTVEDVRQEKELPIENPMDIGDPSKWGFETKGLKTMEEIELEENPPKKMHEMTYEEKEELKDKEYARIAMQELLDEIKEDERIVAEQEKQLKILYEEQKDIEIDFPEDAPVVDHRNPDE